MRERRRQLVTTLIAQGDVLSQEHLAARLLERGIAVNQATLSRDLRDLGVLKGPRGYTLPFAPAPAAKVSPARPAASSAVDVFAAARAYILSASAAANLIVFRTRPGNASPLARELDRITLDAILGTVAGDDTVFMATKTAYDASMIASLASTGRARTKRTR